MILVAAFCAPCGVAVAQSDDTLLLMNRLNDLEAQVQALNRQAAHGVNPTPLGPGAGVSAVAPGGAAADLDVRISQLQDQVRTLTGEIETQGNEIAQMRTESQRINEDLQMRLNDLEAKVSGGAASAPAASGTVAPPGMYGPAATAPAAGTLGTLTPAANGAVPSSGTPEKDYEVAYNQLGQGDYASAEAGFSSFLARYPKHALAANADYWLGETFYARGMMDKAAAAFADTYKQYPNGAKAPDSLLKLGMSLGQQGKTQEACLTFAELNKVFPAASAKIKASAQQERTHYKCQ